MRILLIELFFPLVFFLILFTQVFLPVVTNKKVFPIFRKKSSTDKLLETARIQKEQAEKELEATKILTEVNRLENQSQELLFK